MNRSTRPSNGLRKPAKRLAAILAINFASAVFAAVLYRLAGSEPSNRNLLFGFIISLAFANVIGGLCALALPYLAPRFAKRGPALSWVLFLGTLAALTVIGSLLTVYILTSLNIFPRRRYWSAFYSSIGIALAISLLIGISKYVYEGARSRIDALALKLRVKELEEERARKLALEARLSSLQSRLHPHFLFNTLNSISSLIQEDPPRAERLVERLAALLRFSLDSNQLSVVPLSQELKIVTDYLEIEKARFGEKLRYSIKVPAELGPVRVPPLALQTLVENSLKYAVSSRRAGGEIQIAAAPVGDRVTIEVRDDGPGFTPEAITAGHGLENLQARLVGLFDKEASLGISRRDGFTVVTISLPLSQSEAALVV